MPVQKRLVWFAWKDTSHPLAGGAEVVTDQLLSRLAADGQQAVLLCSGYKGAPKFSQRNGYTIIRVGRRNNVYLAAWLYYRRYLRGWATEAVDECNTVPFFAGWYSGVPTTMFFHMLCRKIWFYETRLPLSLVGWVIEPIYLRLLKRGRVMTVSESSKADLVRNGFKARDIQIISEGITLTPIPSITAITKFDQPTVLSLGSVRSMKRTADQVKALEIARAKQPALQLVIAGDMSSAYAQSVMEIINKSDYREAISVLGRVSSEQKTKLMQQAHVLLVSSVKEGWGLVVTEAASQGTPSVVNDVDGLRDSVRHNATGLVVAPNSQAIAMGIIELLNDKQLYERLQKTGHAWSKSITFEKSYQDFITAMKIS